ncbi:ABC transporter AbcH.1 [Thoreauomyces humboldtii]|nr:ABC transporter AbcH.1 [Thoreauomyces humboldtii]
MSIQRGEWVAIYGTSGGGKTSLLNIIGTIDKPTKGDLTICDTVITPNTKDEVLADLRLNNLGFVFQSFNLIASMTALENVELPMVLKGSLTASERRARAVGSLRRVGLEHRLNHFPSKLSGGEQQRVTIARAIANEPEVLLLDEPTGDLDTANTQRILHLLHELNSTSNTTFVMVTHDVHLKNFAHRVIYMRDGKIQRIEMVRSVKRKEALEDLENKMAELDGKEARRSSRSYDAPPRSDEGATVGTVAGESEHRPGRFVSRATEIREPGDYATYCTASGVPAVTPDDPHVASTPVIETEPGLGFYKDGGKSHGGTAFENKRQILRSAEDLDDIV